MQFSKKRQASDEKRQTTENALLSVLRLLRCTRVQFHFILFLSLNLVNSADLLLLFLTSPPFDSTDESDAQLLK